MTGVSFSNLDSLLLLLYVNGKSGKFEEIIGKRRLAKLLFLISRLKVTPNIKMEVGEFIAYKQGPYPTDLEDIISTAEDLNFIEVSGNCFRLTGTGKEAVSTRLVPDLGEFGKNLLQMVSEIKTRFNTVPEDLFVAYVYLKYPDFTSKSEIKEEINLVAQKYLNNLAMMSHKLGLSEDELKKDLEKNKKNILKAL
jgi:hypothetical protein